jgi:hypothetical protein
MRRGHELARAARPSASCFGPRMPVRDDATSGRQQPATTQKSLGCPLVQPRAQRPRMSSRNRPRQRSRRARRSWHDASARMFTRHPTQQTLVKCLRDRVCPTYRHSAAAASRNQEVVGGASRARGTRPRATERTSPVATSCGRPLQWPVGHAGETSSKRAKPRDERHPNAQVKLATRLQATVEASARRSQGERERPGCNHGPRRL